MSRGTKDLLRGGSGMQRHAVEPQPPAAPSGSSRRPSDPMLTQANPDLVAELKVKVESQRRELDDRADNVNAIQRNFQRLSEMYAGDREKITSLEDELERNRRELESLRAEKKVHAALRAEFAALQQEVEQTRGKASGDLERMTEDNATLKRTISELKQQVSMLESTLQQSAASTSAEATDRAELGDALTAVDSSATALFDQIVDLQKAVGLVPPLLGCGIRPARDGKHKNASLVDQAAALCVRLDTCSSESFAAVHRTLDETASRHDGKLADQEAAFARQLEEREATVAAARAEAAEQRKRADDAAQKLKEASKMYALERQTAQMKTSESQSAAAARARELEVQLAEQREINKLHEEQLAKRVSEAAALEHTVACLREELASACRARDEALAGASSASEAAAGDLASLRAALQAAQANAAAARDEAARFKALSEKLSADLHAAEKRADDAKAVAAARIAELEAQTSQSALSSAREFDTQVSALRKELADARAELELERTSRATEKENARAHANNMDRDVDKLNHDLAVRADEVMSLKVALDRSNVELREARLELENLQGTLGQHDSSATAEMNELRRANEKLERSLADERKRVSDLEASNDRLSADARQSKEQEERAKALHAASTADCEALKKERDRLRADNAVAAQSATASSDRVQALQQRLSAVERDAAEAKEQVRKLSQFQDDSKQRSAALEARMEQVTAWQKDVHALQRESIKTVKKVLAAEEACESGYSCLACLEVMRDPVVCAPCGHSYCRKCLVAANKVQGGGKGICYCPECDEELITHVLPSKNLDLLGSRFEFRKRALRELATSLEENFTSLDASGAL